MIRCNMCMNVYEDYDIVDCPTCETDNYMMELEYAYVD